MSEEQDAEPTITFSTRREAFEPLRLAGKSRLRLDVSGVWHDDGSFWDEVELTVDLTDGDSRIREYLRAPDALPMWQDKLFPMRSLHVRDDIFRCEFNLDVADSGVRVTVDATAKDETDKYSDHAPYIDSLEASFPPGDWDVDTNDASEVQWTPVYRSGEDEPDREALTSLYGLPIWRPERAVALLQGLGDRHQVLTVDFHVVVPRPAPNIQPVPKVHWEGMNVIQSRTTAEAIALIEDHAAGRGVEMIVIPAP